MTVCCRLVIAFFGLFIGVWCQTKVSQSDDGMSGKLSFKTPDLNDEEGHSPWIPDNLRCDACNAVSYQLWFHFESYNTKHKYRKYNLKEWEILDITEELCENSDVFNSYGIKEVDGVHRLSGTGLETADSPGVIAGGGRWPSRLQNMCHEFLGGVGEETIYDVYKEFPEDPTHLKNFLCYGPANTVRGKCSEEQQQNSSRHIKEAMINEEL